MKWQEVYDDPLLRDLPYKIELNEWGQIVMSPASNRHGNLRAALIRTLATTRSDGTVISECSITTSKGVKVPVIGWASDGFMRDFGTVTPYPKAPELCIEILSPSNTDTEMLGKRELYFARGAQEVWLCDEQGELTFFDCTGQIPASRLFPGIGRIESEYLH